MKKITCCLIFAIIPIFLFALEIPALKRAINDQANMLNSAQQEELEIYLRKVNKTSKLQVALLIIPSLEDEALESYSIRVVEKWKLGDKDKDSGVLLLIAKGEKKLRIEVGYGLEKDLTDIVCSKIISNIITPHFKENDYYNGIKEGLEAIVAYSLKDETLIKQTLTNTKRVKNQVEKKYNYWYVILTIFIILFSIFGRRFGGTGKSGWNIFWIFSLIFNLFGYNGRYRGRHKRGQWTPYDGSSFSSDDDNRSDSFSGNGGSFGGGGASGGW